MRRIPSGARLMSAVIILATAGSSLAEPKSEIPPYSERSTADVDADANAAKTILDARQKAVDEIRAGRAAPYYLVAPPVAGPQANPPPPDVSPRGEKR